MPQKFEHIVAGRTQTVKNLAAHLHHSASHRWYYYPDMTTEEVVFFRHYTADRFFAHVHAAFFQPGLPDGADTRRSCETRVLIYV